MRIAEYLTQQLGADPGYTGVLVRNPVIAEDDVRFRIEWTRREPYSLDELADYIPSGWRLPRKVQSAEGRNCTLFLTLCVAAGRPANRRAALSRIAHAINATFGHPLPDAEVADTVRSVERYRREWEARGWHRPDWIAKQAARGRRSGQVRRQRVRERDRAIREAYGAGGVSQRALALEYGVSQMAVWKVLRRSDNRTNTG